MLLHRDFYRLIHMYVSASVSVYIYTYILGWNVYIYCYIYIYEYIYIYIHLIRLYIYVYIYIYIYVWIIHISLKHTELGCHWFWQHVTGQTAGKKTTSKLDPMCVGIYTTYKDCRGFSPFGGRCQPRVHEIPGRSMQLTEVSAVATWMKWASLGRFPPHHGRAWQNVNDPSSHGYLSFHIYVV